MRISETIPTIVTWAEIKSHCRLETETEKTYLESTALASAEAFEKATNYALGSRSITVIYSVDDKEQLGGKLELPKGPVISVTSITGDDNETLSADDYELRRQGWTWYLHLYNSVQRPLTLVYVAGHSTVPSLAKQLVLIQTEEMRVSRGKTTTQSRTSLEGYQRLIDQMDTQKVVIG